MREADLLKSACMCRPRNRRFSYPATPRARAFQVAPRGPLDSASTTPAIFSPPRGSPEAVSTSIPAATSGAAHPRVPPEGARDGANQHQSSLNLNRVARAGEEMSVQATDAIHLVGSANRGGVASAAAFGSVTLEQVGVGKATLRPQGRGLVDVLGGVGMSCEQQQRSADDEAKDDTLSLDEEIKQILQRDG